MASRGRTEGINLCYVDEERGCVVVGVHGEAAAERRLLGEIASRAKILLVPCAPATRHANKQQYNRPLLGGTQILTVEDNEVGTICMRHGENAYVTAGHVVVAVGRRVYQPRMSEVNDWRAGVVEKVSTYTSSARSDSALVVTDGINIAEEIWKSASQNYNVVGTVVAPGIGTAVAMQGASTATTLRQGEIGARNVTVRFDDGGTLTGQLLANYLSRPGDSGAPVFILGDGNNVQVVGLNVGATAPEFVDPKPTFTPSTDGTYAVVSPWANIVADLDL